MSTVLVGNEHHGNDDDDRDAARRVQPVFPPILVLNIITFNSPAICQGDVVRAQAIHIWPERADLRLHDCPFLNPLRRLCEN